MISVIQLSVAETVTFNFSWRLCKIRPLRTFQDDRFHRVLNCYAFVLVLDNLQSHRLLRKVKTFLREFLSRSNFAESKSKNAFCSVNVGHT